MQGACQISYTLSQVQSLSNKKKEENSDICPGKDGETPGKFLWAIGYPPIPRFCCFVSAAVAKLFWGFGKSLLKEIIFVLL